MIKIKIAFLLMFFASSYRSQNIFLKNQNYRKHIINLFYEIGSLNNRELDTLNYKKSIKIRNLDVNITYLDKNYCFFLFDYDSSYFFGFLVKDSLISPCYVNKTKFLRITNYFSGFSIDDLLDSFYVDYRNYRIINCGIQVIEEDVRKNKIYMQKRSKEFSNQKSSIYLRRRKYIKFNLNKIIDNV